MKLALSARLALVFAGMFAVLVGLVALSGNVAAHNSQLVWTPAPDKWTQPSAKEKPVGAPGLQESAQEAHSETPELQGGPDSFGYRYIDSNEQGGPVYQYINASNKVNALAAKDDDTYTDTVPFPLRIYGQESYTVSISVNGHVHFNGAFCYTANVDNTCNWSNTALPSTNAPRGMIAPFWDDINLTNAGGVYTQVLGTSPSRTYVVEWRDAPLYLQTATRVNFELLIEESSGDITFQYGNLSGVDSDGGTATVGIQNMDRNIALQYSLNNPILSQGLAVRFYVDSGTVVNPSSATRSAAPNTTERYVVRVKNQTGVANTYTASAVNSAPGFSSSIDPATPIQLAVGQEQSFTVLVSVPATATLGVTNVTTLRIDASANTATCTNNNCAVTVPLVTAVNTLGADFNPGNREGVGSAAATVSYTSTLVNRSDQENTFTLTAEGNVWPTTLTPDTTGVLAPDSSIQVVVDVTIPADVELGTRDVVTITATGANGFTGQMVLTTIAGNWSTRDFMRFSRSRLGLTYYPGTGKVYALGGEGQNSNRGLPIEEFDPLAGTWTVRASLPVSVSNAAAVTLGDLIYVVGGYNGSAALTTLQTYDPRSNTSAIVASDPLPVGVLGAGVAELGGKIYVVGGSDLNESSHSLYVYDPAQPAGSRWTRKADMGTRRVFLSAAVLDGRLYALGGVNSVSDLTDLAVSEAYDPAANSWTTLDPMAVPRGGLAAVGIPTGQPCGGFVYVVGGGWFDQTAVVEQYSPATGWRQLANMQSARRNLGLAYAANRGLLVAAGGYDIDYSGYTEVLGCGGSAVSVPTVTPGSGCTFNDVPSSFYGYEPITWLACRGIVSGYADNTFRPFNNMTRGQITKVVALSMGWQLSSPATPTFSDVPTDNTFYSYIEAAADHGALSGYADGTFRPFNEVTRGQIAKIVVLADNIATDITGAPHFSDVTAANPFYNFIETAYNNGLLSGYEDNTFRWNNVATRAQVAKVVYLAVR